MKKLIDYRLEEVSPTPYSGTHEKIAKLIKEGYEPYKKPFAALDNVYQAFVKYEETNG